MGRTAGIDPQRKADMECHTCHRKGHFAQECPNHHCGLLGKWKVATVAIDAGPVKGAADGEMKTVEHGLYLPGKVAGSKIRFLVDTGSGVSILAAGARLGAA